MVDASSAAARTVIGSRWQAQQQPELAAFAGWAKRYVALPHAERAQILQDGIAVASARRVVLAEMIRKAPEQALAAAVPVMVRAQLPAEITALLEERVSGRGSVELLAATPAPGRTTPIQPYSRHALVNGSEYEAFSYGRRAKLNYLPDISIVGIALDGSLALSDSPLRVLESGESAAGRKVEEVCAISGIKTPVTDNAPFNAGEIHAVEVNGEVQVVCKPNHIATLERKLVSGEVLLANGSQGSSAVSGRPSYAWTHGTKKVLIIRVDFSDLVGTPVNSFGSEVVTPQYAVDLFNTSGGAKEYYEKCSYGQTSLSIAPVSGGASPDVTPVLRMPATAASYANYGPVGGTGNSSLLHTHAEAAATSAGYNLDNYDRIGVVFSNLSGLPNSKITYGGLGSTPGKSFWINGAYHFGVVAHEIGHNYGLNHASSWQVTDGNPVSPAGALVEYGDNSDVMGSASGSSGEFSHWNKSIAQWLPDTAVTTIGSGGTFRVYRFDDPAANLSNALALKVVRNRTQDYWIGYRRGSGNASFDNGAYVVWGANENTNGILLDLNTPGSNVSDAPLAVGQTFDDSAAGISLTTVARGGSGANEYLDVQVAFQPRVSWTQSSYTVDENGGSATLTLTRSNNNSGAVSVHWATSNGSATAPSDYTASSGNVSWADGDAADKTVTIPIVGDAVSEGIQNFSVTLSSPSGGVIVDNAATTVNIAEPGANDAAFAATFINSSVIKSLVQPDGKIIIGGYFDQIESTTRGGIARITATGGVDNGFAAGGVNAGANVNDIACQPDGKILVVGNFTNMHGTARNRVARLNTDGSLDLGFNPGTGANATVRAVLVQPDGKILIGGNFTSYNGTAREYVARLNPDGSVDNSFTGPDFGDSSGWWVNSLALQPDGKLLIGGTFYFSGGPSFEPGLCRVDVNGALDAAFNGVVQGPTVAGNTNSLRSIYAIVVTPDGKILIVGNFSAYNNVPRGGFAKLTDTGALDSSFPGTSDGTCNAVLVQPDGQIVIGGVFSTFNGSAASNLVRLSPAGVVDTAFVAAGGPDAEVNSLAMQSDTRLVFGSDWAALQGAGEGPLWRIFSGLSSSPGTLQFSSSSFDATEGNNASLTVSRTGGSLGAVSVNYSTVISSAGLSDFTATKGTVSWADGDSGSKTITVPITTDALAESGESFTVNIGQPLMGGAILGGIQSATVGISDAASVTAYQAWRNANFTAGELSNAAISGDNADPDGDGYSNLLEFAFNMTPRNASLINAPVGALQSIGGTPYLTLSFRRRLAAPELTYTPQVNGDLPGTWTGGAVLVGSPLNNGDGTETVTYRDSVAQGSAPNRFMRVQVTLAP